MRIQNGAVCDQRWPDLDGLHLRRPQSTVPDKTPGRHPSRKTYRPRIEDGRPRWVGSRSAPSCFERHGMGDGSFGKLKGEGLFAIGLRGDYATRRNVRWRLRVDGVEVGNSRLTLLQWCRM